MESFDIIKPSSILEPYIKYYWILDYESEIIEPIRVIPYGCVQFTFYLGNRIKSLSHEKASSFYKDEAVISGQSSSFIDVIPQGKIRLISIVFKPFGAKPFFDFPISEIKNGIIPVKDINNNNEWLDIESRLGNCVDNKEIVSCLESALIRKLEKNKQFTSYSNINYKRITHAINEIDKTKGNITIKELSLATCLGEKQFNRVFVENIGSNPKEFLRIIRYQNVLFKLQNTKHINIQDIIYECGYYDQSHFINNFKQFTGYTPKEYIKLFTPCSEYFSM